MNRRRLVIALAGIAGLAAGASAADTAPPAIVSYIDHVVVEDAQATELYKLLTEQFQLPVIWPMSTYGSYRSGGVFFGNSVVEVGHLEGAPDSGHAQWQGIVFAPPQSADASDRELDARHILHDPPDTYAPAADGKAGPALWTTIRVREQGQGDVGIVLCDYHIDTKSGIHIAAEQLSSNQGGPLGLVRVLEVNVEASDWVEALARWQRLLAPVAADKAGLFGFTSGPSIHLLRGRHDAIRSLTVEVRSLDKAAAFLSEQSIAYDRGGGKLTIQQGVHGLVLHLVASTT